MIRIYCTIFSLLGILQLSGQDTLVFYDQRNDVSYPLLRLEHTWWFNRSLTLETPNSVLFASRKGEPASDGRLYSFAEAKRVCPEGWRLPTSQEMDTLMHYIGKMEKNYYLVFKSSWSGLQTVNPVGYYFEKTGMMHRRRYKSYESFNIWLDNGVAGEAPHVHMYDLNRKDGMDQITLFWHEHETHNPIRNKRKLAVRCVRSLQPENGVRRN